MKTLRTQIETKNKQLQNEIEFFNKHDNCPTCKQAIDKQFKCDTIENKNSQITDIQSGLEKLLINYNQVNQSLTNAFGGQKIIQELKSNLYILNTEKTHLEKQIKSLKNHEVFGIHLEGPYLSPKYFGAHDPALLRKPTISEIEDLSKK